LGNPDPYNIKKGYKACGLDSYYSEYVPLAELHEHGNKPSDLIKGGEFLDQWSNCQFLKKDSAL
jgi:hypothetical protein